MTQTIATELGGQTLTDGVYNSASTTFEITSGAGALVLDGQGNSNSVFIFQMDSGATGLVVGPASSISLINGASACNIFWKVNTATINTTATFKGTILANTSITVANGAKIDGRLLASTGNVTLINDTITKPGCTSGSSTTSSLSTAGTPQGISCPAFSCVTPIILESRRVSPTSIFLSWGPYTGMNTYNVQYGVENGKWLYNTNVTGYSTTINGLPPNQPIWFLIQPRDDCSIGPCGVAKLVGGTGAGGTGGIGQTGSAKTSSPLLPNTGFGSEDSNIPWYILGGSLAGILIFISLIQRKYRFLSTH